MKIELSQRGEVILGLVIAAVSGAVFGGLINFSYSYSPELNVLRSDLTVESGSVVSARSLQGELGESFGFPPPLYIWEWVDFEVDVSGVSGGTLEVNFTRDDDVLLGDFVYSSSEFVLSGYGEYRLGQSRFDVKLCAVDADVNIGFVYISAHSGVRRYNPLVSAFGFTFFVGITMLPFVWRRKGQRSIFE